MNLYEITTGMIGESYERCYVWAPDEVTARFLFEKHHGVGDVGGPETPVACRFLFSHAAEPFVTDLSTEGWEQ